MKIRELMICACLLAAAPAIANDHPPSDASIDQLLTLTNARQLLDQMKAQVDSMIAAGMHAAQQGQALTPIKLIIDDGDVCLSGVDLAEEDGLDIPEPDEVPEVQITSD